MRSATATRNACKLCAPLGAVFAFRGVAGALPFLHGSQGCSTYIRRYMIGHFREPIDVASSNFSEQAAVFGGGQVLCHGLRNVVAEYRPSLIGVATTCLSETIGEDMNGLLAEAREDLGDDAPALVHVSTPSYAGSHAEGFHRSIRALIEHMAEGGVRGEHITLIPGMVSPADLRHLRTVVQAYDLPLVLLSDYADSLDGGSWEAYKKLPEGGTTLDELRSTGRSRACIAFGATLPMAESPAAVLADRHGVAAHFLDWPIGLHASDRFHAVLGELAGRDMPAALAAERRRLLDSYVDGHKYVSQKRALLYGEEDLVVAMAGFLKEIGMDPAAIVSGGCSGRLEKRLSDIGVDDCTLIKDDADFVDAENLGAAADVDIIIGHSKGYWLSRKLDKPLLRIGFPVHDRIGGARIQHLGYSGSQQLYDRIANALIAEDQKANPVGYMCM